MMRIHVIRNHVANFALLLLIGLGCATASAGTFHWGDFDDGGVMFLDVTENNDEASALFAPMPGSGGPIIAGNSLHLDPQVFASQSSNNSAHIIDSTLSTVIMTRPGEGIESVSIAEFGDFSLGGLTGGQANAEVGAAFFWTVLEVDNVAVNLSTQTTNLIIGTGAGQNGGRYVRPTDDGTATIWNGTASIDVATYLSGLNLAGKATKLRLTFDNTLQTAADSVSNAFIKKKSIDIGVATKNCIPEPTTAMLVGALSVVLLPRRRR